MPTEARSATRPIPRVVPFVLYLTAGLLIFLFGSNTYTTFPTNRSPWYEWGLTVVLFALAEGMRRSIRFNRIWKVTFGLFVASFADVLNLFLGNWLKVLIPAVHNDMKFLAVDKLSQAIPILLALILLTRLSGESLGSIYLKKGNLRQGLTFGAISFGVFAAIFGVIAILQSNAPTTQGLTASGISLATLLAALPWILVFIFANSLMEELWFRGVSLGKLQPLLGSSLSILVTALVFGTMHLGVPYITPLERFIFPPIVFALGLVNGYVMLKTNSIWGSFLFHAGYDLLVIIPILVAIK